MLLKEINLEEGSKVFNFIENKSKIPSSLSPSIVAIDCKYLNKGGIPKFIYFESGKDIMLYSFIFTPIGINLSETYYDIQSPYGYGGPIATTSFPLFWIEAKREFNKWAKENKVVVEFLRFHPIINNYLYKYWIDNQSNLKINRDTISIDLESTSFISQMRKRFRTYARKWQSYPEKTFSIFKNPTENQIQTFYATYNNHMRYLNASKNYFFSYEYFKSIMSLENSSLCVINTNNIPTALIIIFNNKNLIEYFLGCLADPKDKINSMLGILTLTASYFKNKSIEFYLGGGRSTDPKDSLLHFKSGIGSLKRSYFIGHNVYSLKIYEQLKQQKNQYSYTKRVIFYREGL